MNQNELLNQYKIIIVKIVEIKSKIHDIDSQQMWKYTFPKVAATNIQIDKLENQLNCKLPEMYRSFLLVANGWDSFLQHNDLLSADYLMNQEYYNIAKEEFYDLVEAQIEGVNKNDLIPISVNKYDKDIFFINKSKDINNGKIVWFASETIETWNSFKDFFESMISYNQRLLDQMKSKKSG